MEQTRVENPKFDTLLNVLSYHNVNIAMIIDMMLDYNDNAVLQAYKKPNNRLKFLEELKHFVDNQNFHFEKATEQMTAENAETELIFKEGDVPTMLLFRKLGYSTSGTLMRFLSRWYEGLGLLIQAGIYEVKYGEHAECPSSDIYITIETLQAYCMSGISLQQTLISSLSSETLNYKLEYNESED